MQGTSQCFVLPFLSSSSCSQLSNTFIMCKGDSSENQTPTDVWGEREWVAGARTHPHRGCPYAGVPIALNSGCHSKALSALSCPQKTKEAHAECQFPGADSAGNHQHLKMIDDCWTSSTGRARRRSDPQAGKGGHGILQGWGGRSRTAAVVLSGHRTFCRMNS